MFAALALARGLSPAPVKRGKGGGYKWARHQYERLTAGAAEALALGRCAGWSWAIVTGALSGIVVLDLDGPPALETWRRIMGEPFDPDAWPCVLTPRGYHVYVAYPASEVERTRLVSLRRALAQGSAEARAAYKAARIKTSVGAPYGQDGIDVRADGGLSMFVGSEHKSGAHYRANARMLDCLRGAPWPDMPPAMLAATTDGRAETLAARARRERANAVDRMPAPVRQPGDPMPSPESIAARQHGLLARALEDVHGSHEGARRDTVNRATYPVGGCLDWPGGTLTEAEAEARLEAAGIAVGLPPEEARRTVRAALRDGRRDPLPVPALRARGLSDPSPGTAEAVRDLLAWTEDEDWSGRGACTERRLALALAAIMARKPAPEFGAAVATIRLEAGLAGRRTVSRGLARLLAREGCPIKGEPPARVGASWRGWRFRYINAHRTPKRASGPRSNGVILYLNRAEPEAAPVALGSPVAWEMLAAGVPVGPELCAALAALGGPASARAIADKAGACQRTVRKAAEALEEAGLWEPVEPERGARGRPAKRWRLCKVDEAEAVRALAGRHARGAEHLARQRAAEEAAAELGTDGLEAGRLVTRREREHAKVAARARRYANGAARTMSGAEPMPPPPEPAPDKLAERVAEERARERAAEERARQRETRRRWDRAELAIIRAAIEVGEARPADVRKRAAAFGGSWSEWRHRLRFLLAEGDLERRADGRLVAGESLPPDKRAAALRLKDQSVRARAAALAAAGA